MSHAITIIGCGPGGASHLLPDAIKVANGASQLCGSRRLLRLFHNVDCKKTVLPPITTDALALIDTLSRSAVGPAPTGVLVSGDPGVYSLARLILDRFGDRVKQVVPGIGAGQVAMARLRHTGPFDTVSLHGALPDNPAFLNPSRPVIFLMGAEQSYQWLSQQTPSTAATHSWYWCEDLTLSTERVFEVAQRDIETTPRGRGGVGLVAIAAIPQKGVCQ